MTAKRGIEWTDRTWNPVRGCTKVSAGCRNCYAERFAERWRGVEGHPYEDGFDLRLVPEKLDDPLRWRKPVLVFVNSMSDLFHEAVPEEYIARVFLVMARARRHRFQVLTKRAERMREVVSQLPAHPVLGALLGSMRWSWPLPNVWLGVSAENQDMAEERIPELLRTPAAVRFVSYEPALGPVDLYSYLLSGHSEKRLDWVIAGGESGPGRRAPEERWFTSVRDQCQSAGVPFFFKQWGGLNSKSAGRLLEGQEWSEMPKGVAR